MYSHGSMGLMKIALITIGSAQRIEEISQQLQEQLQNAGITVERFQAGLVDGKQQVASPTIFKADLIVVGSPAVAWKGTIPQETREFIESNPYLEGKKVAVFVDHPIWGADAALRSLMTAVEQRGAFLFDFEVIKNSQSIRDFALRLVSVQKSENI